MNPSDRRILRRPPADPAARAALGDIDPLLAGLYAARGLRHADQLDLSLGRLLPVTSLPGVVAAAERLLANRQSRIMVAGDFDADGATGTALVVRCLRAFGFADVNYVVPDRFTFGYGLTVELVRHAAAADPALILTVDNGTASVDGVEAARGLGIEVIVTDHHLPGAELPRAAAIVNPNLRGAGGPGSHLAGVGVAFYLMAALGRLVEQGGMAGAARIPARYLDLVALGTVADVVPLDHGNRILVSQGLARIRGGRAVPGIGALMSVAGRNPARAASGDLGFAVAPRLNAAGRLEDMSLGIRCLLEDDATRARELAARLDAINRQRRELQATMSQQAFASVDRLAVEGEAGRLAACVCVHDASWHQGLVGLIASRVRERWHRPVIAFAPDGKGVLKGSARSIPGVHVRDLLAAVDAVNPGLIGKFGGHAMAAGLSIDERAFETFSRAACKELGRLYPRADFSGALLTDGELPACAFRLDFARLLGDAGPWGAGFPEPLFSGVFEVLERRVVGGAHLKLRLRPSGRRDALEAIAFGQADTPIPERARLVFRMDVNEWRGSESLQLVVEHIGRRDNMPPFSA